MNEHRLKYHSVFPGRLSRLPNLPGDRLWDARIIVPAFMGVKYQFCYKSLKYFYV